MRRLLVLVAIVLAFPAAAFGVSHGWLSVNERMLQQALAEQYPDVPLARRQEVTIGRLCFDAAAGSGLDDDACTLYALVTMMRLLAVAAAVLAVGWLVLLALAGRLARRSPERLRALFLPGMRIPNVLVLVMLLMQGALAVATSYFGQAWLAGGVYIIVPMLLGGGALIGTINVWRAMGQLSGSEPLGVVARALPPAAAPELWAQIERLSETAGVARPDTLLVGIEPNAFVTDAPLTSLDGAHQGRTLVLSASLARLLSREELGSVITHELAHYRGGDLTLSREFYPIYRGALRSLAAVVESKAGFVCGLTLWPATATLAFFLDRFASAEREISRGRELVADGFAAEITGSPVTATALMKTHLVAQHWDELFGDLGIDLARGGAMMGNVSRAAVDRVRAKATPAALDDLQSRRLTHPFDSHPGLGERLAHLAIAPATVAPAVLTLAPRDAAVELLPGIEALEELLSAPTQRQFAQALGIEIKEP